MEAAPEKEPVSAPVDKTVEMVAEPEKKRLSLADRLGCVSRPPCRSSALRAAPARGAGLRARWAI